MAQKFPSLQALLNALLAEGVRQVGVTSRVVTTIPPGGEKVVYRGRITVKGTSEGGPAEYMEVVKPVAHASGASGPPAEKGKIKLPKDASAQQRRMANQMRYYREAFEWRVNEAREAILRQIKSAGFKVSALQEESTTKASPDDLGECGVGLKRLGD
jgi:hypothetical protein